MRQENICSSVRMQKTWHERREEFQNRKNCEYVSGVRVPIMVMNIEILVTNF